ncbi:MAG: hypothetical protein E6102_03105 [Negativicoccus succinicivorans]|mgnify:CR=1 FL=1|jgi:hypothetical protein|uniref:hypothetical protein n=1 Tax=Negativicoccus succinicivorans TaxID=620903 RepID=UPI00206CC62D|nr:hypothetical protein [Negativicoccus succinicivorans]MDU5395737.1 hypothetical protein [Negativicoccus succinicivorans]DAO25418.1 MAG TPA: HeH/LEM domain [Caudoviricetes sp.]
MAIVAKWTIWTEDGQFKPGAVVSGLSQEEELRLIRLGHAAPLVGAADVSVENEVVEEVKEVNEVSEGGVDLLEYALKEMTKAEIIEYAKANGLKADVRMKKDDLVTLCTEANIEVNIDDLPSNGVLAIAQALKIDTDGKTLEQIRDAIAGE